MTSARSRLPEWPSYRAPGAAIIGDVRLGDVVVVVVGGGGGAPVVVPVVGHGGRRGRPHGPAPGVAPAPEAVVARATPAPRASTATIAIPNDDLAARATRLITWQLDRACPSPQRVSRHTNELTWLRLSGVCAASRPLSRCH